MCILKTLIDYSFNIPAVKKKEIHHDQQKFTKVHLFSNSCIFPNSHHAKLSQITACAKIKTVDQRQWQQTLVTDPTSAEWMSSDQGVWPQPSEFLRDSLFSKNLPWELLTMRPWGLQSSSSHSHRTRCSGSTSFELVLIRQDVFTMRQLAGEL